MKLKARKKMQKQKITRFVGIGAEVTGRDRSTEIDGN
jgi:hypothetical protein